MAKTIKDAKKTVAQETAVTEQKFELYEADPSVNQVPLSMLVALEKTPIEGAQLATREINKQHVSHLEASIEAGDTLPPLTVVATSMGPVVIGGYHRWAAYEKHLVQVLQDADPDGNVDPEVLKTHRHEYYIPIEEITCASPREVLQRSFEDNLKHGLPASDASRSRYGLWLYNECKADGNPISLHEAARRARCTHQAIMKARAKLERDKPGKMVDVQLTEEDTEVAEDLEAEEQQKNLDTAEKHMQNVLKAVKYFSSQDFTTTELTMFVESYANQITKDDLVNVNSFLSHLWQAAPAGPTPEQKELLNTK